MANVMEGSINSAFQWGTAKASLVDCLSLYRDQKIYIILSKVASQKYVSSFILHLENFKENLFI